MATHYEVVCSSLLGDLLNTKLEIYFIRSGFRVMLEYTNREGPDVLQLRRGEELVSIYVHDVSDSEQRLEVDCSCDEIMGMVSGAIRELATESLTVLLQPFAGVDRPSIKALSEQAIAQLWQQAGL